MTKKLAKKKMRVNKRGEIKQATKPEKYTAKWVHNELEAMLKDVLDDPKIIFLRQLFVMRNYSQQRFSDWAKVFSKDPEIVETMHRIENILEMRLAVGGVEGKYNPHMTKFSLINKYDWKDKSEVENRHKGLPSLSTLLKKAAERSRGET